MAPGWMPSFILTLARETGWSETDILNLPMETALEYYHAALWANGAWTVPPSQSVAQQLASVSATISNLPTDEDFDF